MLETNEGKWANTKLRRSDEESPPALDVRVGVYGIQSFGAPATEHASQTSTNRLYLAPQSTMRRYEISPAESCEHKTVDGQSGNATRRRRPKSFRKSDRMGGTNHVQAPYSPSHQRTYGDPYHSDSSNDSFTHVLDMPRIWGDDDEETGSMGQGCALRSPILRKQRSKKNRRRLRRFGDSDSVVSGDPAGNNQDDESIVTHFSNQSSKRVDVRDRNHPHSFSRRYPYARLQASVLRCLPTKSPATVACRRQQMMLQVALFLLMLIMVFDSKAKLQNHRVELQNMQEERAHILEQMTWIDHAAKKVHQHYGTPEYESRDLFAETDPRSLRMREELDQMQLRIQQNSRENIAKMFGEGPAQISLPLEQDGEDNHTRLIISLSDDAPHAVSTFVQQVNGPDRAWDRTTVQRLMQPDDCSIVAIQARTEKHRVYPLLEFLEKSRSCDHVGSVSLHQLESQDDQFELLLLKIRLANASEKSHGSKDDICLGTVISGLDALDSMLPDLPVVQIKGDREIAVVADID